MRVSDNTIRPEVTSSSDVRAEAQALLDNFAAANGIGKRQLAALFAASLQKFQAGGGATSRGFDGRPAASGSGLSLPGTGRDTTSKLNLGIEPSSGNSSATRSTNSFGPLPGFGNSRNSSSANQSGRAESNRQAQEADTRRDERIQSERTLNEQVNLRASQASALNSRANTSQPKSVEIAAPTSQSTIDQSQTNRPDAVEQLPVTDAQTDGSVLLSAGTSAESAVGSDAEGNSDESLTGPTEFEVVFEQLSKLLTQLEKSTDAGLDQIDSTNAKGTSPATDVLSIVEGLSEQLAAASGSNQASDAQSANEATPTVEQSAGTNDPSLANLLANIFARLNPSEAKSALRSNVSSEQKSGDLSASPDRLARGLALGLAGQGPQVAIAEANGDKPAVNETPNADEQAQAAIEAAAALAEAIAAAQPADAEQLTQANSIPAQSTDQSQSESEEAQTENSSDTQLDPSLGQQALAAGVAALASRIAGGSPSSADSTSQATQAGPKAITIGSATGSKRSDAAQSPAATAVAKQDTTLSNNSPKADANLQAFVQILQNANGTAGSPVATSLTTLDKSLNPETLAITYQAVDGIAQAREAGHAISVELNPADYGQMRIEVTNDGGVISARVETETVQAQQAVLDNLLLLRDALVQLGAPVDRVDVVRTDQWGPASNGSNSNQPQSQQQDQSQQYRPQPDDQRADTTAPKPAVNSPAASGRRIDTINIRI